MTDFEPTELTLEDVDKVIEQLRNEEIKPQKCFDCSKDFFPNYHAYSCDECFFSQFPKDVRKAYYQSIINEMM